MSCYIKEMDKFPHIKEAMEYHSSMGGILLVLDKGYGICTLCTNDDTPNECGRTDLWLESLAPSWSEASPENARRDPRNTGQQEMAI